IDLISETQFALSISETNALLINVRNRLNPPKSTKTLEYVDQFTKMRDDGQLNDARRTLSKYNLHQFELPLLLNLLPSSIEEAKTLVPSLTLHYSDNEIRDICEDIREIKRYIES
ncbi:12756_t:CDS:2, partial [Dentiscutata erythropus]